MTPTDPIALAFAEERLYRDVKNDVWGALDIALVLAALRELRERLAANSGWAADDEMARLREAHIETLRDVWCEFSEPCGGGDGWAHDMALSTLSTVAEDLVAFGVFEKHPTMDWYRAARAAATTNTGEEA